MNRDSRNRILAWLISGFVFLFIGGLSLAVLRGQLYANLLRSRNEAERMLSLLFSINRSERESETPQQPGSPKQRPERNIAKEAEGFLRALKNNPDLAAKVSGLAVYGDGGMALIAWGKTPGRLRMEDLPDDKEDFPRRHYLFNDEDETLALILPIPDIRDDGRKRPEAGPPPEPKKYGGLLLYFGLRQNTYYLKNHVAVALFVGWELFLAFTVWLVRRLILKNLAYRREIRNQQQLVVLGSAARTLAHEIKNPLGAIRLQTDVIEKICPSIAADEIEAINQEVRRLQFLVERIGDFLREPLGYPVKLELLPFLREAAERVLPGIRFIDETQGSLVVSLDPERFRSVVENLVRNAVDSGGDVQEVQVKIYRNKARAIVEVSDRGSGLPDVNVEQLFDPFYTTKSKGFGIGLSIAKRFVESAGGGLLLGKREGGGTVAEFYLPEVTP